MKKAPTPRTMDEIISEWKSFGVDITPIEGKPGYWHYHEETMVGPKHSFDAEVTEEEMIRIDMSLRNGVGVSSNDIVKGRFKQPGAVPTSMLEPRPLEDILVEWRQLGVKITPIDGKPGFWFFNPVDPFGALGLNNARIELPDAQIIGFDIAFRMSGITWDEVKQRTAAIPSSTSTLLPIERNPQPRSLEEILPEWEEWGKEITPIESKPGYWLYRDGRSPNPADRLEVEVTEAEMIAIDIAIRTPGVGAGWDDIRNGKFKQS
ncbi:MAG TPA: hypothetical protein VFS21_13145 [Roseiflexaceae bacterium]|nr:hypothetical protein [Roseiflexaceae bacterium]